MKSTSKSTVPITPCLSRNVTAAGWRFSKQSGCKLSAFMTWSEMKLIFLWQLRYRDIVSDDVMWSVI